MKSVAIASIMVLLSLGGCTIAAFTSNIPLYYSGWALMVVALMVLGSEGLRHSEVAGIISITIGGCAAIYLLVLWSGGIGDQDHRLNSFGDLFGLVVNGISVVAPVFGGSAALGALRSPTKQQRVLGVVGLVLNLAAFAPLY